VSIAPLETPNSSSSVSMAPSSNKDKLFHKYDHHGGEDQATPTEKCMWEWLQLSTKYHCLHLISCVFY
jgi:hypothetical protein